MRVVPFLLYLDLVWPRDIKRIGFIWKQTLIDNHDAVLFRIENGTYAFDCDITAAPRLG